MQGDYEYIALRHSPYIVQKLNEAGLPLTEWPSPDSISPLEYAAMKKYPGYLERDQLYDIRKDPSEKINIVSDPNLANVVASMQATLQSIASTTPGNFPVK